MALIHNNIRYLRRKKGLTQEQLAQVLSLKRAVIGSYEEGRAEPKLELLHRMAKLFNVTMEALAGEMLSENNPDSSRKVENEKLRVLSITVDSQDRENIELVQQKAAAGYLNGYADPEYVEKLPRFRLPMLPPGTYRAFEITGDSMLPLMPGTIVIGEYAEDWKSMRDGQTYVLVTNSEGVVYKRVKNRIIEEGMVILQSDNPAYLPYSISSKDVLEVWKAKAFISLNFPANEMSMEKLAGMVLELQREIIKMKK